MNDKIHNLNGPLTEAQKCFIPHLLEHCIPEKAARAVGLSPETVEQWMKQSAFKWELDRLRRQSAAVLMMSLEKVALKAVKVLGELLADEKPDSMKLKAADSILEKVIPYGEHFNLKEQIAELKQIAENAKAQCAPNMQAS